MTTSFEVTRAKVSDIGSLISLYHMVYGNSYPISYGTDPEAAKQLILSKKDYWFVVRDPATGKPVASLIVQIDSDVDLGHVVALVVHPDFQSLGLGSQILKFACSEVFSSTECPNSVYATTRTNSIGPQKVFLKNGFLPMGIFPNSHFIEEFETLTLFIRYRDGVLVDRLYADTVPLELKEIYGIINENPEINLPVDFSATEVVFQKGPKIKHVFEKIDAPTFVAKRFSNVFKNKYDRYYPFHKPNFLMTSRDSDLEVYMHVNHKDRYSAILACNKSIKDVKLELGCLISELRWSDISYVECLIPINDRLSLETMLQLHFIPSALYPAMLPKENGRFVDFVLLSRTFESLNFEGIFLDGSFKKFIDQYVKIWEKQALQSLEVVHASH